MLFTARTYFDWGKALEKTADKMKGHSARIQAEMNARTDAVVKLEDCKKHLLTALHLSPSNYVIWFDLALAQLALSTVIIGHAKPTVPEVRALALTRRPRELTY